MDLETQSKVELLMQETIIIKNAHGMRIITIK